MNSVAFYVFIGILELLGDMLSFTFRLQSAVHLTLFTRPLVLRNFVREAVESMNGARFLGYRTTNGLYEAHWNSVTPACVRGVLL